MMTETVIQWEFKIYCVISLNWVNYHFLTVQWIRYPLIIIIQIN